MAAGPVSRVKRMATGGCARHHGASDLALAAIVLLVALRLALGLTYRPDEIYTVMPL